MAGNLKCIRSGALASGRDADSSRSRFAGISIGLAITAAYRVLFLRAKLRHGLAGSRAIYHFEALAVWLLTIESGRAHHAGNAATCFASRVHHRRWRDILDGCIDLSDGFDRSLILVASATCHEDKCSQRYSQSFHFGPSLPLPD